MLLYTEFQGVLLRAWIYRNIYTVKIYSLNWKVIALKFGDFFLWLLVRFLIPSHYLMIVKQCNCNLNGALKGSKNELKVSEARWFYINNFYIIYKYISA